MFENIITSILENNVKYHNLCFRYLKHVLLFIYFTFLVLIFFRLCQHFKKVIYGHFFQTNVTVYTLHLLSETSNCLINI